ncbi:hypothetical protein NOR_08726 [Metarhizium rileyi]|uniref:Uncharacterized protein n=1 Tax=Metarhizium rileyi (strain RCEF 4871) TaxID=1649241 RepID=A0A166VSH5_METRR|nr:hypothetical protein NOR_08726 [Metarhizium rileyi RCEF 4871]
MCPIGRKKNRGQPEYVRTGENHNVPTASAQPNMMGLQGQARAGANLPGPAPHTAGPHRHDILNKLDPTVDSHSGGAQILGPGASTSRQAYAPSCGQGMTSSAVQGSDAGFPPGTTAYTTPPPGISAAAPMGNVPEGTYGPHSSRVANALDPRVDSDVDAGGESYTHGRQAGMVRGDASTTGTRTRGGMHGGQQPRSANTLDQRVGLDPNLRGAAAAQGQTPRAAHVGGTQPGPAPNTAGPHRTNLMNKLDPSVDSERTI